MLVMTQAQDCKACRAQLLLPLLNTVALKEGLGEVGRLTFADLASTH